MLPRGKKSEETDWKQVAKDDQFRAQQELLSKRKSGELVKEANARRKKVSVRPRFALTHGCAGRTEQLAGCLAGLLELAHVACGRLCASLPRGLQCVAPF